MRRHRRSSARRARTRSRRRPRPDARARPRPLLRLTDPHRQIPGDLRRAGRSGLAERPVCSGSDRSAYPRSRCRRLGNRQVATPHSACYAASRVSPITARRSRRRGSQSQRTSPAANQPRNPRVAQREIQHSAASAFAMGAWSLEGPVWPMRHSLGYMRVLVARVAVPAELGTVCPLRRRVTPSGTVSLRAPRGGARSRRGPGGGWFPARIPRLHSAAPEWRRQAACSG